MKKTTSTINCMFALLFMVNAQVNYFSMNDLSPLSYQDKYSIIDEPNNNSSLEFVTNKSVSSIPFSSSSNAFTVIVGKKMSARASSKHVLHTHRGGGSFGSTGDDIKVSFSSDYGENWESVIFQHTAPNVFRYPGAALFSPQNSDDVYVVATGPYNNGSAWKGNYIASARTDGQHNNVQTIPFASNIGMFHLNEGVVAFSNGNLFVVGTKISSDMTSLIDYSIFKFIWDDTQKRFVYDKVTEIKPNFVSDMPPVQPFGIAFSENGAVGYFWVNGQISQNAPNKSTQPLIWKTTDNGNSWNMQPVFDFSTINELKEHVWALNSDNHKIRPLFLYGYSISENLIPGTVDKDGNLHIITTIVGGVSNHADSLDLYFLEEPNKIFLLSTSGANWNASLISEIQSKVQEVSQGGSGQLGDFALDHRVHIGKTNDGNKIFAMWTDSEISGTNITENIMPDFYAWGKDISTGYATGRKNFTKNTPVDGSIIYMNASDIILYDNSTYHIPASYIEITNNSNPAYSPIIHRYIKNIGFKDVDFVINPSINKFETSAFVVSQNYPNPFRNISNIDVQTDKSTSLTIEIQTVVGQLVYQYHAGQVQPGTHTFTIDGSNLQAGIYLYTVKTPLQSVTRKMIVN